MQRCDTYFLFDMQRIWMNLGSLSFISYPGCNYVLRVTRSIDSHIDIDTEIIFYIQYRETLLNIPYIVKSWTAYEIEEHGFITENKKAIFDLICFLQVK